MSEAQAHDVAQLVGSLQQQMGAALQVIERVDTALRGDGVKAGVSHNAAEALRMLGDMRDQMNRQEGRLVQVEGAQQGLELRLNQRMTEHEHQTQLRFTSLEAKLEAKASALEAAPAKEFATDVRTIFRTLAAAAAIAIFGLAAYGFGARQSAEHPRPQQTVGPTQAR